MPEGGGAGVLHGEQLPVAEAAEDGQVRGRMRDELLPGAEDQEAEGAAHLQRRHAVHQGRGDHTQVRVREKMLLTTRPLHDATSAPDRSGRTADVRHPAATATAGRRRRAAARGRARRTAPATAAATPRRGGRLDEPRVRLPSRVRRGLRHRRAADRRHLVRHRLYISSSAVTTPAP